MFGSASCTCHEFSFLSILWVYAAMNLQFSQHNTVFIGVISRSVLLIKQKMVVEPCKSHQSELNYSSDYYKVVGTHIFPNLLAHHFILYIPANKFSNYVETRFFVILFKSTIDCGVLSCSWYAHWKCIILNYLRTNNFDVKSVKTCNL